MQRLPANLSSISIAIYAKVISKLKFDLYTYLCKGYQQTTLVEKG